MLSCERFVQESFFLTRFDCTQVSNTDADNGQEFTCAFLWTHVSRDFIPSSTTSGFISKLKTAFSENFGPANLLYNSKNKQLPCDQTNASS